MVYGDMILTLKEEDRLNQSLKEYKENKTISFERLKNKILVADIDKRARIYE